MTLEDSYIFKERQNALKLTKLGVHRRKVRRGAVVIVALTVITAVEYWVAVAFASDISLMGMLLAIAAVKTWLVVDYFMSITRMWMPEEME